MQRIVRFPDIGFKKTVQKSYSEKCLLCVSGKCIAIPAALTTVG